MHALQHPSALTAYDHAMLPIQAPLTFAPTLDKQHSWLVSMHSLHTIPLDYTSYHTHAGHLKQAFKTLEQERALLWSEMRSFHTLIDQTHLADSNLAEKFSMVNHKLETLTQAPSPNNNINVDRNNDLKGMNTYGHSVMWKEAFG